MQEDLFDEPPSSPPDDVYVISDKINNILDIIKNGTAENYNTLISSNVLKSKTANIIAEKLYEFLHNNNDDDSENKVEREVSCIYLEMMLRKQLEIDFSESRIFKNKKHAENHILEFIDDKNNNSKSKFKPMNIIKRIKKNIRKRFKLTSKQIDTETELDDDDDDNDDDNKYIDKVISLNENRLLNALNMAKLQNKPQYDDEFDDSFNDDDDDYSIIDDREQLLKLEKVLPKYEKRLYPNIESLRNSLYDTLNNRRSRSVTPSNLKSTNLINDGPSTSKKFKNDYSIQ